MFRIDFVKDVKVGSHVLIDDGELDLEIIEKKEDYLLSKVRNEATLSSRKV